MNEPPELSLYDWLQANWSQPIVQRRVRLGLAVLAAGWGLYQLMQNSVGVSYFFFGLAIALTIWSFTARGESQLIPLPSAQGEAVSRPTPAAVVPAAAPKPQDVDLRALWLAGWLRWPLALGLALSAQWVLEFQRAGLIGSGLYFVAGLLTIWAFARNDLILPVPTDSAEASAPGALDWRLAATAIVLGLITYWTFGGGMFNSLNLVVWALTILYTTVALRGRSVASVSAWGRAWPERWQAWTARVGEVVTRGYWINPWRVLLLVSFLFVAYFRFTQLDRVTPEMTSDHAEKLLDVMDVLHGDYHVFFNRNTGREFLQFYMGAFVAATFGTGVSFLTLKIVTAFAGLAAIPYVYLLGKEVADRRVGWVAMLLAGVAYWPNVTSRVGLRFPLYPMFAAPALYYLLRGLRTRRLGDFIWSGIALGIGLHGYSSIRVLPLVMMAAVAVYVIHRVAAGYRWHAVSGLGAAFLIALVIALPLLRSAVDNPDLFWLRTLTRLGETETVYPGNPVMIFLSNEWNSLRMFGWDNGNAWILGVPNRPALDVVTAAFFHLGALLLLLRYLRTRRWADLFVLIGIPLLMLPSTLALAFPIENPALNRASGAVPLVFLLPALAAVALYDFTRARLPASTGWRVGAGVVAVGLAAAVVRQNYTLTFVTYPEQYRLASQMTSEIGYFVRDFAGSVGRYQNTYVVPFPYWVDTRLVGMYAGDPARDYALPRESLEDLQVGAEPLLIIFHKDDNDTAALLRQLFPLGHEGRYASITGFHHFRYYLVPARTAGL
jgi:hypothetical protein